jgi:hypothetical protein
MKLYELFEAKAPDVNFDADDIKNLERINDLDSLKRQAFSLISNPGSRPMKPEKVSWFRRQLASKTNKMAVIKMMYDLMLSGEGNSVLGSRSSTQKNSYRRAFGESGPAHLERAFDNDLYLNMGNGYWVGSMLHDDGDSRKVSYSLFHTTDAESAVNPHKKQLEPVWRDVGFLRVSSYRATPEEIKAAAQALISKDSAVNAGHK